MNMELCIGCAGLFPRKEGDTHRYLESSPGCAEACGRLFAQHYEHMDIYGDVYRLANDAYAVQHPGRPSRQTINSAAIHLIRLCLTIEQGLPAKYANDAVLAAGQRKEDYWWLKPPVLKGSITVADFVEAMPPEEHRKLLRRWAGSAWEAWAEHHDTIRQWLPAKWKRHAG
ncbi:MAG TPA: DUF5946 family protein [Verrucomicrobiota bacterium]|nr:DUF5946 family protein [Verrucomicrobiota bacterium]